MMNYRTDYLSTFEDHCYILRRPESSVILNTFTRLVKLLTLSFFISSTFSGSLSTLYSQRPAYRRESRVKTSEDIRVSMKVTATFLLDRFKSMGDTLLNQFRFYYESHS